MYPAPRGTKRPAQDLAYDLSEPQIRVLIPDEATSKVIGDRGATISGIAKGTGTHMHVSRETWPGTLSRILTVRSKTQPANIAGAAAEALRIAFTEGQVTPEAMTAQLIIPVRIGPLIVGKGGSRVTELQQHTQTFISIKRPPPGMEEEEMVVQGSYEGIAMVLNAVASASLSGSGMSGGFRGVGLGYRGAPVIAAPPNYQDVATAVSYQGQPTTAAPEVPQLLQGELEPGTYAAPCEQLAPAPASAADGTAVPPSQPQVPAEVYISDQDIMRAPCFVKMQLPSTLSMGSLIGKGGVFMRQLHQESGASKLHIADATDGRWLEIHGSISQVQMAMLMVQRRLLGAQITGLA